MVATTAALQWMLRGRYGIADCAHRQIGSSDLAIVLHPVSGCWYPHPLGRTAAPADASVDGSASLPSLRPAVDSSSAAFARRLQCEPRGLHVQPDLH